MDLQQKVFAKTGYTGELLVLAKHQAVSPQVAEQETLPSHLTQTQQLLQLPGTTACQLGHPGRLHGQGGSIWSHHPHVPQLRLTGPPLRLHWRRPAYPGGGSALWACSASFGGRGHPCPDPWGGLT